MKKILFGLSLALACNFSFSQNKKQTILSIDDQNIPLEEFIYVYEKNNSKQVNLYSKESLQEHMNLFVNYRLKVKEAESRKLDTNQAFKTELEGYRRQLAKPYLTDDSFLEKMTQEAYQRIKEDVSSSHILFMVDEFASPEDTLIAYNKAIEVRKKAISGSDFGQLALEYSEDPSAKDPRYEKGYKGNLGYFPAFSFVYPFESAAYNTAVGQISMPVRTKYGYHIIKVNEKRANQGEVKVAHIMIDAKEGIDLEDSLSQRKLAYDIYNTLKSGADWSQTCAEYSSDKRSAERNGELPSFQLDGKMRLPSFEKAAFALKNVGDISQPIKTPFGWHIIKLIEKIPVKPYAEIKEELEKQVKRSDRFALSEEVLNKKLKAENNFKESKKIKEKLSIYADSTLLTGTWQTPKDAKLSKKAFSIDKKKYTYGQFFAYLEKNQTPNPKIKSPKLLLSNHFNTYVNKEVYSYAEANLSAKHDDYRLLLKEFRDGILFFEIMQNEVWSKASSDTNGIKSFYAANMANYPKPKEAIATVYKAKSLDILNSVIKAVNAGKSEADIKSEFTKESSLDLIVESKTYDADKTAWVKELKEGQKTLKNTENEDFYYVVIKEIIPAGIKPLNKCRGLVIADYQTLVEKQWIESLKKKYNVSIQQDVLNSLVK